MLSILSSQFHRACCVFANIPNSFIVKSLSSYTYILPTRIISKSTLNSLYSPKYSFPKPTLTHIVSSFSNVLPILPFRKLPMFEISLFIMFFKTTLNHLTITQIFFFWGGVPLTCPLAYIVMF